VFGVMLLFFLVGLHSVLYLQARPAIVDMMCEEDGDLLSADIFDATYVLAWFNLNETVPSIAAVAWRCFVPLSSGRHPAVQRYSDLLNGPPLFETCTVETCLE
jgi:hypothetical protein